MGNSETLIQFGAKTVNNHKQQHPEDFVEMNFISVKFFKWMQF